MDRIFFRQDCTDTIPRALNSDSRPQSILFEDVSDARTTLCVHDSEARRNVVEPPTGYVWNVEHHAQEGIPEGNYRIIDGISAHPGSQGIAMTLEKSLSDSVKGMCLYVIRCFNNDVLFILN